MPAIPHAVLAASIVDALIQYAEQLLAPFLQAENPASEALRHRLHAAERAAQEIKKACDRMLDRLDQVDDEGKPLISGPAVQALSARYADRVRDELEPARAEVDRAKAALDASLRVGTGQNPAIHSALLLRMVESLRDPHDTTYNDLWKAAIRIEKITREQVRPHETVGTMTRWEGTIRIAGAGHEFVAPFHGEYLAGNAAALPAKVDQALELLLAGVPFADI